MPWASSAFLLKRASQPPGDKPVPVEVGASLGLRPTEAKGVVRHSHPTLMPGFPGSHVRRQYPITMSFARFPLGSVHSCRFGSTPQQYIMAEKIIGRKVGKWKNDTKNLKFSISRNLSLPPKWHDFKSFDKKQLKKFGKKMIWITWNAEQWSSIDE